MYLFFRLPGSSEPGPPVGWTAIDMAIICVVQPGILRKVRKHNRRN